MLRFLMICEVLCISGMITGCDIEAPEAAEVRDIGLPASGTPPSGDGIAPISGRGGDGSPVVVAVGGWSTGPGAVKWHGGQWVIPYGATPSYVLANAWCDVVPRADATALVELVSSNGQVLGSSTVPATTQNIVIRSWPFVGSHVIADGEQVVMRISPKDTTTGAWTTAAQDMTVIGCAVNARRPSIILSALTVVPENPVSPGASRISGTWTVQNSGFMYFPIPVVSGSIDSYQVWMYKQSGSSCTLRTSLFESDPATRVASEVAQANNATASPGALALGATSLSYSTTQGKTYYIRVGGCDGVPGSDSFTDASIALR